MHQSLGLMFSLLRVTENYYSRLVNWNYHFCKIMHPVSIMGRFYLIILILSRFYLHIFSTGGFN